MKALLRDGPNTGGRLAAATMVRRTVLALLLVFAWIGQSWACFPEACVSVEKYVSLNGLDGPFIRNSVTTIDPFTGMPVLTSVPGVNNVPAPSVNIPVDFFGDSTKVLYKFVITNCGKVKLVNVRLSDCIDTKMVGDTDFLEGIRLSCELPYLVDAAFVASSLEPGASVVRYGTNFPSAPIFSVDVCDAYGRSRTNGEVRNDVFISAGADRDGDGVGEKTCYFQDLNLVQCKEFVPQLAKLGDRVWRDLDNNGIQDCQDTNNNGIIGDAGDTGAECSAGIPGVTVNLVNCQSPSTVLASTQTDANGFYLFDNLIPGQYCVRFDRTSIPASACSSGIPQFTTQNVGDDAFDSDANTDTGLAPAVTLISGETNRTVDAGVVCQGCPVSVDKTCVVETPPPTGFVCSNAKPIDSLTMIWTGQSGIYIKAWKGLPGSILLSTQGPIATGQKVTVTGMGGSPLDQVWEIFSGLPDPLGTNKIGQSQFHISCSDVDMNGPEDCGKLEGNAKTTSTTLINLWLFDGMAGNGQVLTCTPPSQTGQDACTFVAAAPPSCASLGVKPKTLVFRFTGNDCAASRNNEAPDKWACSGLPGTNPVVSVISDPSRITVSPTTILHVGDLVTVSAIGTDMGAEIQLQVGGQFLKIHTSCSQPLAVGDSFGSLELVQFNGQGTGSQVTYSYAVKNEGSTPVEITSVADDKLGELLAQPATVAAGATMTLDKTAFISQTTTNHVTATARLAGTTAVCGQAQDQLTVTVTQPTCDVGATLYTVGDDRVSFKVSNTSSIKSTLETFLMNFPASYGAIKEIDLDGAIFKSSATVPIVLSGQTIGSNGWTNLDITKRQLDPRETRTLTVIFTKKGVRADWGAITNVGSLTFREGCQETLPRVQ